jgi:hypothetical protein
MQSDGGIRSKFMENVIAGLRFAGYHPVQRELPDACGYGKRNPQRFTFVLCQEKWNNLKTTENHKFCKKC